MDKSDIEKIFGVTNEQLLKFSNKCLACGENHTGTPTKADVLSLQEVAIDKSNPKPTGNYQLFYKLSCKKCGHTALYDVATAVNRINMTKKMMPSLALGNC